MRRTALVWAWDVLQEGVVKVRVVLSLGLEEVYWKAVWKAFLRGLGIDEWGRSHRSVTLDLLVSQTGYVSAGSSVARRRRARRRALADALVIN